MSRNKAIEICKNLNQTVSKMKYDHMFYYEDTIFEKATVRKSVLNKIKNKLIKKYTLTNSELKI